MSVDVFGRQLVNSKEIIKGPPGIGFALTVEGDYDIQNKRLCNVDDPLKDEDAVNLQTLNSHMEESHNEFNALLDRITIVEVNIEKKIKRLTDLVESLKTTVHEKTVFIKDVKIENP